MAVQFVDEARIFIKAGNGGQGCVTFAAPKSNPRRKVPTGGMGGSGGNVIVVGNANLSTLMDFRYKQHYQAENGANGGSNNRYGQAGADLVIELPLGTVITSEAGESFEIVTDKLPILLQAGGKGGRGNNGLRNQHIDWSRKGEVVDGQWYTLELKIFADVGVVGLPNAGKSSLVRAVSGAKPKVADYPFTTLHPTLGVVTTSRGAHFTLADIPGLIAGAHEGHGLGNRFLRHISRVSALIHLIDVSQHGTTWELGQEAELANRLLADYATIRQELESHDPQLLQRPYLLALNKIDQIQQRQHLDLLVSAFQQSTGQTPLLVSTKSGEGLDNIIEQTHTLVVAAADKAVYFDNHVEPTS